MIIHVTIKSSFQSTLEVVVFFSWDSITVPCDWLKNLAPLPQPIRSKAKPTFPRLIPAIFPPMALAECTFPLRLVIGLAFVVNGSSFTTRNYKPRSYIPTICFTKNTTSSSRMDSVICVAFSLLQWNVTIRDHSIIRREPPRGRNVPSTK